MPDREAGTLTDWLVDRPSIETVARDHSITYRNGIMMGRPDATQIADRWHLLSNLGDVLEKIIESLLKRRKTTAGRTTEPNGHNQDNSRRKADFEALDDWQWEHSLKESFEQMKRNACRLRLLPHLPEIPKIQAASRQIMTMLPKSPNRAQSHKKFDAKTLCSLCFRQGRFSEDELETLCLARAEWDEFDRAYPLAEEFVKIVRGQGSMSIGL